MKIRAGTVVSCFAVCVLLLQYICCACCCCECFAYVPIVTVVERNVVAVEYYCFSCDCCCSDSGCCASETLSFQ